MTAQRNARTRKDQRPLAAGAVELRFARPSRLLKHSSFQIVYEKGRRHFSANMSVFYLFPDSNSMRDQVKTLDAPQPPSPVGARIGLTVGRVLGGAVVRNRIKRRTRDAVRHNLGGLNSAVIFRGLAVDVVINPKKSALHADASVLRTEVGKAFQVIAAAIPATAGKKS